MINTTAIPATDSSAPTQGGHGGNASGPAAARGNEFLAAVNRITFSSSPAVAIAQNVTLPDTTRSSDQVERNTDYGDPLPRRDEADQVATDRPEPREAAPSADETTQTDAPEDVSRQEPRDAGTTTGSEPAPADPAPQGTEVPAASHAQGASPATANAASAQQATNTQPSPQAFQTAPAKTDTPDPQGAAQQQRPQSGPAHGALRAQVVDAAAGDQVPQTNQTLSSRAALVAQSQTAKGAATDTALQGATTESGASSLFASATRAAGQGAQKGKGAARSGSPAQPAGALGAAAAQATQTPAQQTAAQATAPFQTQLQQNFANTQFGSGTGTNAGGQPSLGGRAEAFGATGTGQTTPHFNPRAATAPQAPRTTPQVPPRVVANQVAVQIQKAAVQGTDRISIQLKPADLGRVEVRLDVGSEGRVAAVITADRADTLDLLQRDARILQNALQDAGLQADSDSLSFELKGQNQTFADSGTESSASDDFVDAGIDTDLPIAAMAQPGIVTSDRIDIQI